MEIYHLVYISTSTAPLKPEAVQRILDVSSVNNEKIQVTGLLLYRFGFFVQLLEGEDRAVRALFDKISKDPRHRDSRIMLEFHDTSRLFPLWNMGVIKMDEDANQLATAVKALRRARTQFRDNMAVEAMEILKAFSIKYGVSDAAR